MENQVSIPKLRFPEFEGEWEIRKFDELFLFSTGKNIKQNEASPEFNIPCVRYGELYHMYNEVINEVINKTNLDESELLFSDGNEILLPSAGEDPLDIGSASALTINNVAIGRTINILKPLIINVYSQIFVAYYINHKLKKSISKLAKGVSISNVYNSDLKTLEINLPTLPEQTKIANFLSAVDEKIQALKKKKGLLEQYKKGVMQKLFSQELRFKDTSASLSASDGNEFPEWGNFTMDKLLSIPEKIKPAKIDKEKLLTVKLHLKGVFRNQTTEGLSIGATNYYLRKKGQFIYGKQNLFNGAFGLIPDEFDGFLSSGDVPTLDINSLNINSKFLLNFFGRESFYKRLEDIASGSGSKRIHEHTLLSVEIKIPSLPEQTKIANFLSAIDDKIKHTDDQIQKMEMWKKGLLQQMFV